MLLEITLAQCVLPWDEKAKALGKKRKGADHTQRCPALLSTGSVCQSLEELTTSSPAQISLDSSPNTSAEQGLASVWTEKSQESSVSVLTEYVGLSRSIK